jgi:hypothetical protein
MPLKSSKASSPRSPVTPYGKNMARTWKTGSPTPASTVCLIRACLHFKHGAGVGCGSPQGWGLFHAQQQNRHRHIYIIYNYNIYIYILYIWRRLFCFGNSSLTKLGPFPGDTKAPWYRRAGGVRGGRLRPKSRAFAFPCRAQGPWILDSDLCSMPVLMVSQC